MEKDYRLARVAKISLYMNGAGEGNIVFGDGLESLPERQIENGTFDILVANPPYSVKDFKQHLKLKKNSFELLEKIGDNGSEIETLFVERIAQLLKPKGVAAVILPSSILSNDSASYTGAREQILQNFLLRGIVQFGGKTFGATCTSTVVLFLEKYNEPPKHKDMACDSVRSILLGTELDGWQDKEILENYVAKIKVSEELYFDFTKQALSLSDIAEVEYFKMYLDVFFADNSVVKYKSTRGFKNLSDEEKQKQLKTKFYQYVKAIEYEKLFYFALTYTQKTVIITAPIDNAKQKDFLGYEWSNRKGNEGIQIIQAGGKMYCDTNRRADGTLSSAIRQSFLNKYPMLTEENCLYASIVPSIDMLDFSRLNFNKSIRPSGLVKFEITSKYPLKTLGELDNFRVIKGKAITRDEAINGPYKVVAGGVDYAYYHNNFNREENIITISTSGANAGYVNYWNEKIFASDCTTIQFNDTTQTLCLYYYLKNMQKQIFKVLQKGAAQPHVYPEDIKRIPVPVIPVKVQKEIVQACMSIDSEYNSTRMSIEEYGKKIEDLFEELDVITKNGGGGTN